MVKNILRALGIVLLVLTGILLFNTFRAKPQPVSTTTVPVQPLPDSAVVHFSQAIQIPTISISETDPVDTAAFTAFGTFLQRAYPLIHQRLSHTVIRQFSHVFEWKGQDTTLKPFILMGHYDVVPVESAVVNQWTAPPFSGTIKDSAVWGRGSTDDKIGVIAILEATEALLRKGFTPQRTIWLCFGHDEELRGRSAVAVAQYLEQKKVHAEMVLDEGGQLSVERAKQVKRPLAIIGVAEKGYASFELSVQKEGGHSMMPAKETAIDILAAALYRLRQQTPPSRFTPTVKEFLEKTGAASDNFTDRMAAANLWLFSGVAKNVLSAYPEGAAMLHTTIAPTIIQAGVKENVIPSTAKAIVNARILPGETAVTVEQFIRSAVNDERVTIRKSSTFGDDPSPETSTSSAAYKRLENVITKLIPDALPVPYLGIGATDSRHYRRIADGVVNFFPMTDAKGFHGINEHLPIRDLRRCIQFITMIIEEEE